MKSNNSARKKLCSSSSLCSCDLLARMHQNFLRKFKLCQVEQMNDGIGFHKASDVKTNLSISVSNESSVSNEHSDISIVSEHPVADCGMSIGDEVTKTTNESKHRDIVEIESMDYEILNDESSTPVPIFEMMSETELNAELAKYGHGPMGKRAAIKLLNQIFEATHPVLSQSTPIPRKLARLFHVQSNSKADICRQKRTKSKIARLMEPTNFAHLKDDFDQAETSNSSHINADKENRIELNQDISSLSRTVIEWLRKPQNEELYNDVLLLNPIFFDRLYPPFKQDIKEHARISKEIFSELLDKLGIIHCSRNSLEDQ